MEKKQRISAVQRAAFFLLMAIEERQGRKPVPSVKLLAAINQNSTTGFMVHPNNFNASMRTLAERGQLNIYRDRIYLAYTLTDAGLAAAQKLAEKSESNEVIS